MGTIGILIGSALLGVVSWEDAGHLPPITPPRPAPIEPDAPSDGPPRAAPQMAPPQSPRSVKPVGFEPTSVRVWTPDAAGHYWVRRPDGSYAGDPNRAVVSSLGEPIDPATLPRAEYSAPMPQPTFTPMPSFGTPAYYQSCPTGTCRRR